MWVKTARLRGKISSRSVFNINNTIKNQKHHRTSFFSLIEKTRTLDCSYLYWKLPRLDHVQLLIPHLPEHALLKILSSGGRGSICQVDNHNNYHYHINQSFLSREFVIDLYRTCPICLGSEVSRRDAQNAESLCRTG